MTAESPVVDTMECASCQIDVPAGAFCGACGCDQIPARRGPLWLRPRTFSAEPSEAVLRPSIASALFPHLSNTSRRPFRVVLVIALAALLSFALLKVPAAGTAVAALGLPLLFVFYLHASRADCDIPRSSLILAGSLGALLGVGWVVLGGVIVARHYGVPMAVGVALHYLLRAGVGIPVGGLFLMTVPAFVVRFSRPAHRDALDGFVIGALGALSFTAAATLTRMAPQFASGLIAHARPVKSLFVEAALAGVTGPITAAAAGGMVGLLLWFRHSTDEREENPGRVRIALILLASLVLILHIGAGVSHVIGLAETSMLLLHGVFALIALIALRVAMQLALLHEAHDEPDAEPVLDDQPVLCTRCGHVIPDMAFCPACGAAARASTRTHRQACRATPLQDKNDCTPGHEVYPSYALPAQAYAAPELRRPRFNWLLGRWGIGVAAVAVVLGAVAVAFSPRIPHYLCPPECGHPPIGMPVSALPRFTAADGAFTVAYPAMGSAYEVEAHEAGVTAKFTAGDGGVMQLFAQRAGGRSPKEIATAVIRRAYPDARTAYEIPNAMVGYRPGYGEVADDWPQSSSASSARVRIIVMTAIKDDVALVAFATGPYHAFGPDFGPGPPSGANLEIAQDMGKYVNSFHWNGDPPR